MPPKKAAAKGAGKGKRRADSEDDDEYVGSDSEAPAPTKAASKKKARRSSAASGAVPVTSLVSRLARSALETLVVNSILKGVAVNRTEVEELLDPSQVGQRDTAPRPSVQGNASLVESGPFQALDKELTLKIFSHLNLRDRLACISEARPLSLISAGDPSPAANMLTKGPACGPVCKGWRSLRKESVLWTSIKIGCDDYSSMRAETIVRFTDAGLQAFLLPGPRSPLPSPGCVQELHVIGGKEISTKTFKSLIRAMTGVTRLSISGKKIAQAVISELAAAPLVGRLRHLGVGNTATGLKKEVFLDVFAKAPLLESLHLYASIDSAAFLRSARDRIAAARDGGTSLVRRLCIGADGSKIIDWESGMSAAAVGALGAAFPELEELTLSSLHPFGEGGMPHHAMFMEQDAYFDIGGGDEDELEELWARPWQPLPRLTSVEICGIGCSYRKVSIHDAFVSSLLSRLAAAAPGLRKLAFSRGYESKGSGSELKSGWRYKRLPRPSQGLPAVLSLASLESLSLGYMLIGPTDCKLASLPSLTALALEHCGSRSAAAALTIAAGAPKLRSLRLANVASTDEGAAASGAGIAGLLPPPSTGGGGGDDDDDGAGGDAAQSPLARLVELSIEFDVNSYHHQLHAASLAGSAVAGPPAALGEVVRQLAARRLCPALRSLTVNFTGVGGTAPEPSWFSPAHPWAGLTSLSIKSPGPLPAAMNGLRAPDLLSFAAPPVILAGGVVFKPVSQHDSRRVTPEITAMYEGLRTGGCPKLPPLTEQSGAAAGPNGTGGAGGSGGAGGDEEGAA